MIYALFIILVAVAIFVIRVLLFREHKATVQLPAFKKNYCQAICKNDDCDINQTLYYPPEKHNRMLILLHRLVLTWEDVDGKKLKCPWCGEPLHIEPPGVLFKATPPGESFCSLPWEKKT